MIQKLKDENDIEWEGDHKETETQPLISSDNGKPIVLRCFEFELPPGVDMPSNLALLEAHKSRITTFLWKDELIPIQEFKVVKAKDQKHFRIFATCQAKAGSAIIEKPKTLQKLFNSAYLDK
jgi:hypothetical protein